MRRLAVSCALLIIACRSPDRIDTVSGDTVILNANGPVSLPVHVLAANGKPIGRARVRYALLQGRAAAVTADSVSCHEKGDARVRISSGTVHRDVTVLCRPFHMIGMLEPLNLVLDAPPTPFPIRAYDEHRRPVGELAFGLEVMDTSVVIARNGSLVPRRTGVTWVRVYIGSCIADVHVFVVDTTLKTPSKQAFVSQPPSQRKKLCAQWPSG